MKGAHPRILDRLVETNLMATPGYGEDAVCESARNRIRTACGCPEALVQFVSGGTQANSVMIDALLRSYQGVIAADTGHINVHESGAIEAHGHKILTIRGHNGKLTAEDIRACLSAFYADETNEHMVMPGMVYISLPTEYGTLYSRAELEAVSRVCREYDIALYVDGARLAYALACPANDVTLRDLAALADAFYIGGTKCGAMMGEAVVIPKPSTVSRLFTITKQHGAVLAKGRMLGIQYDELFRDDLYLNIGRSAIEAADRMREGMTEKGYELCFGSPTNQVFCKMDRAKYAELIENVSCEIWEPVGDKQYIVRFVTDWATSLDEVDELIRLL